MKCLTWGLGKEKSDWNEHRIGLSSILIPYYWADVNLWSPCQISLIRFNGVQWKHCFMFLPSYWKYKTFHKNSLVTLTPRSNLFWCRTKWSRRVTIEYQKFLSHEITVDDLHPSKRLGCRGRSCRYTYSLSNNWCALYIHVTVHRDRNRVRTFPSWLCLEAVIETCVKLTNAECTVENSWWWTEKMPETCRVLWQNKFG